jgi:hypothetical protein
MTHTYRLKAGDNPGASQYEYGYQANDPNAANPSLFTVQGVSTTQQDAKNQAHALNKKTPGEGRP